MKTKQTDPIMHNTIEQVLGRSHDAARFALYNPEKQRSIALPVIPAKRAGTDNVRIATALAMIYSLCTCLIDHYKTASANQAKKVTRLKSMVWRLLPIVSKKITNYEIGQIDTRLDTMNLRLKFDDQPSWQVYISFSIGILSDAFTNLEKTRLSGRTSEIEDIIGELQVLHNYMTKNEGRLSTEYDLKAYELYDLWERLF